MFILNIIYIKKYIYIYIYIQFYSFEKTILLLTNIAGHVFSKGFIERFVQQNTDV